MMRETEIADAEAPSAAIAMRGSKRRNNSSSTNMAPASGALNAVARPAPAPAATSALLSSQLHLKTWARKCATLAPICTLGPSRPRASPEPMASTPPTNFAGIRTIDLGCCRRICRTASTSGMPLPDARGANRRTSHAAHAAAAAQAATTNRKPASLQSYAEAIQELRSASARVSASRKRLP